MKQSVIKEMATNELEALLETEKARLEKMKVNHMVSPLEKVIERVLPSRKA